MSKGWLELESDPGLFTLLLEENGVLGVQVEEIYDLQKPIEGEVYGFIFLFRWIEERRSRRKTNNEVDSFVTDAEAVNKIFFAQQIIPNSCATHALLSVLLNCDNKVKLGKTLTLIKDFTDNMSPEDKGFAIANMPELARVHNSFARPETSKPVPEKQAGLSSVTRMESETFHFVSYVPIRGHLFELDGLKPHPIDHGTCEKGEAWTEKFRKVISARLGMATGGEPYHDIRFNLMAVVPDKRQLLEQKLTTLKTNRSIVLEALQQVVSPTSSEKSDSDGRNHWAKKSVTFEDPTVDPVTSPTPSTSTFSSNRATFASSASPYHHAGAKPNTTLPISILKTTHTSSEAPACSRTSTHFSSATPGATSSSTSSLSNHTEATPLDSNQMKLRSAGVAGQGLAEVPTSGQLSASESSSSVNVEKEEILKSNSEDIKTETVQNCTSKDNQIKNESMDTSEPQIIDTSANIVNDDDVKIEIAEVEVAEVEVTEISEVEVTTEPDVKPNDDGMEIKSDVTKPLSIETKFSISPCAGSSESTDTASEVGSGFSSPGSLNTSSCQSSPQYSDGTLGPEGHHDAHHHHRDRRKRRSSQAFTPKDLLDLLKNVENEIELCEANLREENEKRKKYKIDACRRTHNYDQFIVTFLSMMAEQGLLGDLMEQNMTVKKPHGNTAATPKMSASSKKALLKASEKKKKSKLKKKEKKGKK